jgi:hypothetical protein
MDSSGVTPEHYGADRKKNDYYRHASRAMMLIVNIETYVILTLSLLIIVFITTRQNPDRFYAETADGKTMHLVGLPLPNMGRIMISEWAAKAAGEIMTFGFNDVDARFGKSRKLFTPAGWETFRKAVVQSKLLDQMAESQQVVTTVPAGAPVLKKEGLINEKDGWEFEVPILVTFRAGGVKVSRPKTEHMIIEKMPTRDSPNGVGIGQWDIY